MKKKQKKKKETIYTRKIDYYIRKYNIFRCIDRFNVLWFGRVVFILSSKQLV